LPSAYVFRLLVFAEQFLDASYLGADKALIALETERVKPELCQFVVTLNMYVWRFVLQRRPLVARLLAGRVGRFHRR
jgi:hypothetical protein